MSDYCKGGCGIDFDEFPEMRHTEDECSGPECTCYEIIGGHQMGCYFYGRSKTTGDKSNMTTDWILDEGNKQNERSNAYGFNLTAIVQTDFRKRLAEQIRADVERMNQWLLLRSKPLEISGDSNETVINSGSIAVRIVFPQDSDQLFIHYPERCVSINPVNKTIQLQGRFRHPSMAEEVIGLDGDKELRGPAAISEAILSILIPAINELPVPYPEWLKV